MSKIIIAVVFLSACGGDVKTWKVEQVEKHICIDQCSRSFWSGNIDPDKYAVCKEMRKNEPCCVWVTTNEGSNMDTAWTIGEIGRATSCVAKGKT